jgi:hypothetical protein
VDDCKKALVLGLIAAAAACGNRGVEAAARRALRRHVAALPAPALRRAVQHSLRAAEAAVVGKYL